MALAVLAASLMLPAAAAGPGERCSAAKLKAAGHKTSGLISCHARARLRGEQPDPGCIARVEDKFMDAWARIESRGGCTTQGDVDDIEAKVDAFVADLGAELPPPSTSTTTTTSTSCPPSTAFYCGLNSCQAGISICPPGMTCNGTGPFPCACEGPSPPCGDLSYGFCQYGACPAGMTCSAEPPPPGGCATPCACQ